MNARSVSISAARKLGKLLLSSLLFLMAFRPARGSEITITVTGTLAGGFDKFGIFGMGATMPGGTPFTAIYVFDDTKGGPIGTRCSGGGTGIIGTGPGSPGTATLTINGKSYGFGKDQYRRSNIRRGIASSCSESEIALSVEDGPVDYGSGVSVKITPNPGARSLTQDSDWRSAFTSTSFLARNTYNFFVIRHPGDSSNETKSFFIVSSVTVSGSKSKASK